MDFPKLELLPVARTDSGPRSSRPLPAGSRRLVSNGYVNLKLPIDHPLFDYSNAGWIGEHQYVVCRRLRRPLVKGEEVHHKNGKRSDNRSKNLELWIVHHPRGQRVTEANHCPTCTCREVEI